MVMGDLAARFFFFTYAERSLMLMPEFERELSDIVSLGVLFIE